MLPTFACMILSLWNALAGPGHRLDDMPKHILCSVQRYCLTMIKRIQLGLNVAAMHSGAAEATAVLRVLANEDRLLLLCELSQGEKSVGELEELLELHQPTLSLGVLRTEGLVETRRDGKRIYYSVADRKVLTLLKTLYDLYCPKDSTS